MQSLFNKLDEPKHFSEVYALFWKPVLHFVSRRVKDLSVAEELTQEIFLKVFRFSTSFNHSKAFKPWLWTIARNTINDWSRNRKTIPSSAPSAMISTEVAAAPEFDIPCHRPNAEVLLLEREKKTKLHQWISGLRGTQKQVLLLRLVDQLSNEAIADHLGLSLSAVKSLIHRAVHSSMPTENTSIVPVEVHD
ncbi:sigma-70 family RNA polymerase sigma factor [Bdellovibrionota bacterium FG-2]